MNTRRDRGALRRNGTVMPFRLRASVRSSGPTRRHRAGLESIPSAVHGWTSTWRTDNVENDSILATAACTAFATTLPPKKSRTTISPDVVLGDRVRVFQPDLVNLYGCTIDGDTKTGAFVEIQKNAVIAARCDISCHTLVCLNPDLPCREPVDDRRPVLTSPSLPQYACHAEKSQQRPIALVRDPPCLPSGFSSRTSS